MDACNLVSFTGIFVLMGVAWVLSTDRRNVNWRVIGWGVALQLLIAGFIYVSGKQEEMAVAARHAPQHWGPLQWFGYAPPPGG